MVKEDEMISTEEQCNVLEELFVEMLHVFCEPNCCLENIFYPKAVKSWIFGGILCLRYNCMTKSSNGFISATEGVSDESRLVNAWSTSFSTVTKTSSAALFE